MFTLQGKDLFPAKCVVTQISSEEIKYFSRHITKEKVKMLKTSKGLVSNVFFALQVSTQFPFCKFCCTPHPLQHMPQCCSPKSEWCCLPSHCVLTAVPHIVCKLAFASRAWPVARRWVSSVFSVFQFWKWLIWWQMQSDWIYHRAVCVCISQIPYLRSIPDSWTEKKMSKCGYAVLCNYSISLQFYWILTWILLCFCWVTFFIFWLYHVASLLFNECRVLTMLVTMSMKLSLHLCVVMLSWVQANLLFFIYGDDAISNPNSCWS
jgi:hypothetical protein